MAPALLTILFAKAVQSNGVGVVVAPTVQLLDTGGAGGPTASVSAQVGEQRAERRATSVGWFRLSGDSLACRVEIMSRARPVQYSSRGESSTAATMHAYAGKTAKAAGGSVGFLSLLLTCPESVAGESCARGRYRRRPARVYHLLHVPCARRGGHRRQQGKQRQGEGSAPLPWHRPGVGF